MIQADFIGSFGCAIGAWMASRSLWFWLNMLIAGGGRGRSLLWGKEQTARRLHRAGV